MRHIIEILSLCKAKGIFLDVDESGEKIKAQGNTSKLTLSERESIKENKAQILEFLIKNRHSKYTSIPLTDKGSDYALSSAQRRLWIVSQHKVANVAYNVPMAFVFDGTLDRSSLSNSFKSLIARHEILRTVFVEKGGVVRQIVKTADELGFELGYKDLQGEKNPDALVKGYVNEDFTSSFDLASGPLLRAGLYRLGHDRWLFTYVMHHIISDGWSMDILIKELFHLYDCYKGGKSTSFPELRIQYKDYAEWQQGCLKEDTLDSHRTYWLKQFEGELPVLELPAKGLRPPIKTFIGATVTENLSPELSDAIKSLCQENGCTLFMGLLAGVNALLFRYTGQNDIVLGSPIAGREHSDLENQIGFYVNTLALRTRFQASESYLDLLGHVRKVTLEAYQHQAFPFDELVTALKLRQDVSRNPLFDGWVVLHNENEAKFSKSIENRNDLKLSRYLEIEQSVSRRDLTYTFIETSKGIELSLGYNSDIYSGEFVEQMARHFVQLMSSIISGAGERICDLDYLNEFEKREILFDFNQSSSEQVEENSQTVLDLFSEQVEKTPDNTAVVFENIRLTYRELDQISDYLNNYLVTTYDVQSGDLVGIKLERSEWMIVSILSVLKSGAAYVPIDVDYPEDRIAYMIEDSQCKVMIDQMELTKFQENKEDYRVVQRKVEISPKSLAYVIYTSGSTGKPKGVMISHQALVDYIFGILSLTNIKECKSFGLVSTISADLGNTVLYPSLVTGGELNIFSKQDVMNPKFMQNVLIDCVKIVPGHWKALQSKNQFFIPNKCLIFGGESLSKDVLDLIPLDNRPDQVYNHYGPSETTIGKLLKPLDLNKENLNITLGSTIGNNHVYVLDENLRMVPKGIMGEIFIAGVGLALGYFKKPQLTKGKFISNPYFTNQIMYRTGDFGRWLPDMDIEFMGRRDGQIKLRGYRIELGEIENSLKSYKDIISAAVVFDVRESDKEIIAFYTSKENIESIVIRGFLEKMLPNYMVPQVYVQLKRLPLNLNGKVDKKALRIPKSHLRNDEEIKVLKPTNKTEKKLLSIWTSVLDMKPENIGIKDNFFDLGGHSLKAIKIVFNINQKFGLDMDISILFDNPTIEKLATEIDNIQWLNSSKNDTPIENITI